MKIFRKAPLTLLEAIIASVITAFILSTLLYFYSYLINVQQDVEKMQSEAFQRNYLFYRLHNSVGKANGELFFTTDEPSHLILPGTTCLTFIFDNCINLDKSFSYLVIGKLFVDQEENLTLLTWPIQQNWETGVLPPVKKEILAQGVESLDFSFLPPPNEEKTIEDWAGNWERSEGALPIITQVKVNGKEYKIVMIHQKEAITYP